ncbi:hypothetical protein RUM43_000418 [Polyplax serrata]|uniref:Uncharacterized protein n=1 Tax=Polyplax serrata TaxID=468196 RepID=A0AAN8SDZ9_POLSC
MPFRSTNQRQRGCAANLAYFDGSKAKQFNLCTKLIEIVWEDRRQRKRRRLTLYFCYGSLHVLWAPEKTLDE